MSVSWMLIMVRKQSLYFQKNIQAMRHTYDGFGEMACRTRRSHDHHRIKKKKEPHTCNIIFKLEYQ